MSATVVGRIHFLRAFHSRPFAFFWAGQTISIVGNGAFTTVLAWQVLVLTHSATAMGLYLTVQMIPTLLFLLVGGIAADRLPRRLLLLGSDGGRAVVVLLIALLSLLRLLQLWHLLILGFTFGVAGAFFLPAFQAMPPQLVERSSLPSANALTQLSIQAGMLLGPVIGAICITLAGPSLGFAFDGLTFLVSVLSLWFIRQAALPVPTTRPNREREDTSTVQSNAPAIEHVAHPPPGL